MGMDLQQLPPELLLRVAQQLPCDSDSSQLAHAAATCSALRRATAAARSSISISKLTDLKLASLRTYLARHGQHVSSISLCGRYSDDHPRLRDLPGCSQLRELVLTSLSLQLAYSTPQQPGVLHGATTALTKLCIECCQVADGAAGFAAIAALTSLQHLVCDNTAGARPNVKAPGSILSGLQDLTFLRMVSFEEASTLRNLSCLTSLQELQLLFGCNEGWICDDATPTPAVIVPQLQHMQQLRVLRLDNTFFQVNSSTMPFFTRLTGLQHLDLYMRDGKLDPAMLASFQQLRVLRLPHLELIRGGTATLLAQVQQLEGLSSLKLALDGCAAPPQAFSALTASSCLTELDVSWQQLRGAVWDSMFPPAGRQLTALKYLWFSEQSTDAEELDAFTTQQLTQLAACCPSLEALGLEFDTDANIRLPSLGFLTALTALETLVISNVMGAPGCAALAQLTTLTTLSYLEVAPTSQVDIGDLMQLTVLTQLTFLEVDPGCFRETRIHIHLYNAAGAGEPPDVALRLAQKCSRLLCEDEGAE